jgi:hypothetical protein
MTGTTFHPLSEQIANTIKTHGFLWTQKYYVKQRKVPRNEFLILALGGLQA